MEQSLDTLGSRYAAMCRALGVRSPVLKTRPTDSGEAHVELISGSYNYVTTERGSELERKIATDQDEVLYWLLSEVAFGLAISYEAQHRVRGQSFRRLLFAKEIELMQSLDVCWGERKRHEIAAILAVSPYDDDVEG